MSFFFNLDVLRKTVNRIFALLDILLTKKSRKTNQNFLFSAFFLLHLKDMKRKSLLQQKHTQKKERRWRHFLSFRPYTYICKLREKNKVTEHTHTHINEKKVLVFLSDFRNAYQC